MRFWKIYCMEDSYPGLWHTWFKEQVVAVGWPAKWGYKIDGGGKQQANWSTARKALRRMEVGDQIVVQLKRHRVGRVGELVRLDVEDDQWNPTVPRSSEDPEGEMGRRVLVRWDLATGPTNPDQVVQLPPDARFRGGQVRRTLCEITDRVFERVKSEMGDDENWVSILPNFAYERSLSDYIVSFPHRVEDGLKPYPSARAREFVFGDRSRADVLLIDRHGDLVIVECKQGGPTPANIRQLRRYMKRARRLSDANVRGILVHGGARKLSDEVRRESVRTPSVELLQYTISVGFLSSQ